MVKTVSGIRIVDPRALLKDWAEVYSNNSEEKIACYSFDSVSILETKIAKMKDEIGILVEITDIWFYTH